jgi:hypothetical protein
MKMFKLQDEYCQSINLKKQCLIKIDTDPKYYLDIVFQKLNFNKTNIRMEIVYPTKVENKVIQKKHKASFGKEVYNYER